MYEYKDHLKDKLTSGEKKKGKFFWQWTEMSMMLHVSTLVISLMAVIFAIYMVGLYNTN